METNSRIQKGFSAERKVKIGLIIFLGTLIAFFLSEGFIGISLIGRLVWVALIVRVVLLVLGPGIDKAEFFALQKINPLNLDSRAASDAGFLTKFPELQQKPPRKTQKINFLGNLLIRLCKFHALFLFLWAGTYFLNQDIQHDSRVIVIGWGVFFLVNGLNYVIKYVLSNQTNKMDLLEGGMPCNGVVVSKGSKIQVGYVFAGEPYYDRFNIWFWWLGRIPIGERANLRVGDQVVLLVDPAKPEKCMLYEPNGSVECNYVLEKAGNQ